jgi:hypothetical protein
MEALNIANNFEEAYEDYEREPLLLVEPVTPKEILQPEEEPLELCMGLRFAVPISLLMWGGLIWVFL